MDLRKLRETPLRRFIFEEVPLLPKHLCLPVDLSKDINVEPFVQRAYESGVRSIYLSTSKRIDHSFLEECQRLSQQLQQNIGALFVIAEIPAWQSHEINDVCQEHKDLDALVFSPQKTTPRHCSPDHLYFAIANEIPSLSDYYHEFQHIIDGFCFLGLPFGLERLHRTCEELMLPCIAVHDRYYASAINNIAAKGMVHSNHTQRESLIAFRRSGAALIVSEFCSQAQEWLHPSAVSDSGRTM